MLGVSLVFVAPLLSLARGLSTEEACYNTQLACFQDNNLLLGPCTQSGENIRKMIVCLFKLQCTTSDFHDAIIQGYRRRVMEQCQDEHCLTVMRGCLPHTKDYWHQLPAGATANSGICSEFNDQAVRSCIGAVASACENTRLLGFIQSIDMTTALSAYINAFCLNDDNSCLMSALKVVPGSHLSFTETGQSRYTSACTNRATVDPALEAVYDSTTCANNFLEKIVVDNIRTYYNYDCDKMCEVKAQLCLQDYYGVTATDIQCSGDKSTLLSCLNGVKTTYTCSTTETTTIDAIKTSVNANC